jgi:gliding motility-associated-like protein
MDLDVTVNGVTTRISGSPDINLQNTAKADLPNCSEPPILVSQCSGKANTYNDWVRYTFPSVPCGTDVSIKIISGNTAFTADCGGMYPVSTATFQIPCPSPPAQLQDVEACADDIVMSIPFPNSNQAGVNYEWTNNNPAIGLAPSGNGDIPTFTSPPSTQTEVATIDVVQGCNQSQFNITIHPQPEPNFILTNNTSLNPTGAPITTCLYDRIYFQSQSIISAGNIQSVLWDFGEAGATSSQQNSSHQYATDGTFDVTLTTTSDKGCVNDVVQQVVVHPVPEANLLQTPVCLYDSVQFEDSSLINFPDYIDQTITNFGDGSPIVQYINPKHLYPSAGSYNISYIVISNHGCIDNTSTVAQIYSVPVANYTFDEVCENKGITSFSNASVIADGIVNSWQWNFDDPVNGVSTLPNPQHNYSEDGVYNVKLVVGSDKGCFDTIVQNVTVLPKPTTIFASDITEACADACINFIDYSNSNATVINYWEWSLDGGDTSYLQNPSKCYSNSSNTEDSLFSISLVTRNDLGCFDTIHVEDYIAAWHNPISDFERTPEKTNIYLPEIEFTNNSIGADFYTWDFGDGNNSNDFEPSNLYGDSGTYEIELGVETRHGCRDTSYKSVRVDPVVSIYIPNTFTPDGDGVNDGFFFKHYAIIEESVDFKIFDKWGTLIYFTDSFIPWDGTYKGSLVKQDTYIYKFSCIDFFGKEHKKKGHVNLLK